MSFINVTTQPNGNSYVAAYRPIIMVATESNTTAYPLMTYCDVYINNIFYKTLQNNTPTDYHTTLGNYVSNWTFDIQGVVQEALGTFMPDITLGIVQSPGSSQGMVLVKCYFRSSTSDAYGVVTPEAVVPVQATVDSAAVSGTGCPGNPFYAINAALQQLEEQDVVTNLAQYVVTNANGYNVNLTNVQLYPLTHMPRARVFLADYGKLALLTGYHPFNGNVFATPIRCWLVFYDGTGTLKVKYAFPTNPTSLAGAGIYLLPTGPNELINAIGANNWDATGYTLRLYAAVQQCVAIKGNYYRIVVEGTVSGLSGWTALFATPPYYIIDNNAFTSSYIGFGGGGSWIYHANSRIPHTRIWFRNYLGQFDQVNFRMREETLRVSSSPKEKPLTGIPEGTAKTMAGKERMNVRSNENNVVTEYFQEDEIPWLKELMASSKTYVEMHLPQNTPTGVLVPIRIMDADFDTKLWEAESYYYKVTLKYEMSNENIIVRS